MSLAETDTESLRSSHFSAQVGQSRAQFADESGICKGLELNTVAFEGKLALDALD